MNASAPCALCGESRNVAIRKGSDRLYRTTDEIFTIVRCTGCGLARLDPPPADPGRYYPDGYWHEAGRLEEMYRRLVLRDHVRFARQALPAERSARVRVLDVGCGSGLFLRELRAAHPGVEAAGMDASPRAAALAWRRNGVPAAAGDLLNPPFAGASFDLIAMFHVLEHLRDPGACVDAARRLLAPGGKFVLQTPNLDCWQYRVFGSRWSGLDIPRHLHDFRLKDLLRLLESRGFRAARVKHFSWRDNPAGLATTIARGREPGGRAAGGGASMSALYLALTAASLPFAALEAFFGHGASVMVEAMV